jgi:hypothetical protein
VLEWPQRAPAGRCHERLGHGLAVRSGRDRISVASQNASRVRHLHMTTTSAAVSTRPGRVTLGRWQVLRASARVWAAPPGAATPSGGCAASRRQWLTDETDSPLVGESRANQSLNWGSSGPGDSGPIPKRLWMIAEA